MIMTLEEFAERALDVPFVEKGRDYDGWDCWGLVYCCYRDVYGITLPSMADQYGSVKRLKELAKLIDANHEEWAPTDNPQPGNVAILRMSQHSCHVGIMLTPRIVLHIEEVSKVSDFAVAEEIDRAPWKGVGYNNVEGIYRYDG